jgi:flagellar biogenesis protein FliO
MLQQSLAVFLVLALLLAALWLLRRQGLATSALAAGSRGFGRRSRDRRLQLIERLALTPHHSLHLVSMGDQTVVFATSPTGCERVDQVPQMQSITPESSGAWKSGADC